MLKNKKGKSTIVSRGVHGLGWVGFVPNPEPTRMIRVEENVARNRPREVARFFGSGLVGSVLGLSPGTKSGQIWPKNGQICRDLA